MLATELNMKRWELLRELVPTAKNFGLLVNPDSVGAGSFIREVSDTASKARVGLHIVHATSDQDLERAFVSYRRHVLAHCLYMLHRYSTAAPNKWPRSPIGIDCQNLPIPR